MAATGSERISSPSPFKGRHPEKRMEKIRVRKGHGAKVNAAGVRVRVRLRRPRLEALGGTRGKIKVNGFGAPLAAQTQRSSAPIAARCGRDAARNRSGPRSRHVPRASAPGPAGPARPGRPPPPPPGLAPRGAS